VIQPPVPVALLSLAPWMVGCCFFWWGPRSQGKTWHCHCW